MNKTERHQIILDYMHKNGKKGEIEELVKTCGVTNETIRKDLIQLEKKNLIRRVLGGAVLVEEFDEKTFNNRYWEKLDLKNQIAAAAVSLINDRDFIALDSGTTTFCLAKKLQKNVTVLTNSLDIARELAVAEGVRCFVAGGELRERNMSMTGETTEKIVGSYRVSKCFLTSEGVGLGYGMMDAHESESRVKRAMMSSAEKIYLLADHTKFSILTPIVTAPLERLTGIITDSQIDPKIVNAYEKAGIPMIVADPDGSEKQLE